MIYLFLLMATMFGIVLAQSPSDAAITLPTTMYPDPDGLLCSFCHICGSFPPNICFHWINEGVQAALAAWPSDNGLMDISAIPGPSQISSPVVDALSLQRMNLEGTRDYDPTIPDWNNNIYFPGDRVSDPQGRHNGADPGGFICKNCNRPFVRQCDLTRHRKTHRSRDGGERPHSCSECGMGFNYPKDLRRHEKTHPKEGQPGSTWTCDYPECANKWFSRKDNLARHVKKKHGSDTNSTSSWSFSTDRH